MRLEVFASFLRRLGFGWDAADRAVMLPELILEVVRSDNKLENE